MASCEGKKLSWISGLFVENQQPVKWLKNGKKNLYRKYKECKNEGRKPISESKFRDGLSAGNFKEMARMTGLCNICNEVGAKSWDKLFELIDILEQEMNNHTVIITTDVIEEDEQEGLSTGQ